MAAAVSDYHEFIASKRLSIPRSGFSVAREVIESVCPMAKPFQVDIVLWSLLRGKAAIFADCGLGKTLMQLMWSHSVHMQTGGRILILCPMAVSEQTVREAVKFGIPGVKSVKEQADCDSPICVTNYERLHLLDCQSFVGVVLDESSILKSFTGKIKQSLCREFRDSAYKLACTATPAPNDRMELGNHSEFLGIMPSSEMLARFFINDTMKAGGYTLKGHAAADFWRWMASWSVCISTPADIGHDATGYVLPALDIKEHVVTSGPSNGTLYGYGKVSATSVHKVKRACLQERASLVANLIGDDSRFWTCWCDTDYEADAILKHLGSMGDGSDGIVEVRGSQSERVKSERITAFSSGTARTIVTKPEIGGFGLNWQHCCKAVLFASYSYERFYQLIRRLLRFGQESQVTAHIVMSEAEESIIDTIRRKQSEHEEMQSEMAGCMREAMMENIYGNIPLQTFVPKAAVKLPKWVKTHDRAI